jgi:hypothetical protein
MSTHQVQIVLPYFTGIPEDVITNVWHFEWLVGTPSGSNFTNLRNNLDAFYTSVYTIGAGADWIAPWVDISNCRIKVYDLDDPIPRAPVYENTFAITATPVTNSSVPLETAICLSFQGEPVSGTPQARRRGRIFIGGWAGLADAGDATSFPEVSSELRTGICAAAETLYDAMAEDDWFWVVWSRVDEEAALVTNGWVDNAFDTQRRRGNAATARTTFATT